MEDAPSLPPVTEDVSAASPVPAAGHKPAQPNGTHTAANGHGNGHFHQQHRDVEPQAESAETRPSVSTVTTKLGQAVTSSQAQAVTPKNEPAAPVEEKHEAVPSESSAPSPPSDEEKVKKRQNVLQRVIWTFIMIFGFIGTVLSNFVVFSSNKLKQVCFYSVMHI